MQYPTAQRSEQSASYFLVSDGLLLNLEQMAQCTIKGDREAIQNFILKYQNIIPYLQKAPGAIREQFGKAALSLELRIDPEIEDDLGTLVMNADVAMDVEEGVEKFTQFVEGWLFDVVGEDIDIFMVDVHFV